MPYRSLPLFSVRRADIATFARELESKGRGLGPPAEQALISLLALNGVR